MPLLDYGARFYNPALARWTTLDPLAEKYYSISPYAFCNNNPVNLVDPDGRSWGKAVKVVKKIHKTVKTGNKVSVKNILKSEALDIADNVKTIFDSEASGFDKGVAAFDLLTGFGDEAGKLGKALGIVHGNSKSSTKAQHAYDIIDKETGRVVKTGVSGGRITKEGKSYRGESQARKWNREEGTDKYESKITHEEPEGEGARERILEYEKNHANELREQLDYDKHKRP